MQVILLLKFSLSFISLIFYIIIQFIPITNNIDDKDSYAFGDSNNDIHMFERVTNSIVMGNGNPELFENATFVTKDIDEDGIEHAMKHFNII